jgi:hypothetical protein
MKKIKRPDILKASDIKSPHSTHNLKPLLTKYLFEEAFKPLQDAHKIPE